MVRTMLQELLRGRRGRFLGKQALRIMALALIALLALTRAADPLPWTIMRQQVFDLFQRLSPRQEAAPQVMIVDLDEASLAKIGQWPWSRAVMASLLERILSAQPLAVGFDMLFAEPDRLSPRAVAASLLEQAPQIAEGMASLPDTDAMFAQVIATGPVVLAEAPLVVPMPPDIARGPARAVPFAELGGDPRPWLMTFADSLRNRPELDAAARGHGSITLPPELDNVVRSVPLLTRVGQRLVPALTVEMLRVAAGETTLLVRSTDIGIGSVIVAGRELATDGRAMKAIHFGPAGAGRYLSAAAILGGAKPPEALRGRYVLIGSSATGLLDIKATPIARAMPGVEIHAQLLETILANADLTRPPYALGAEIVVMVVLCLAILLLVPHLGGLPTLLLGGGCAAVLATGSWYLFTVDRVLIDATFPAVSGLILYSVLVYGNYLREERRRKSIRRAFARYLPDNMVERLVQEPEQLKLGGELRPATVMFVDIRGFTGIAERLPADQLTSFVNRVLTSISGAIHDHGGTIDKYIGDATMAFWNAPLLDPQHERHACLAALAIQQAAARLDLEFQAEAEAGGPEWPRLRLGVGLNSGDCFIGNMGSAQRFNYSAIGNTVNIAARLEALSKAYDSPIIVGERTAAGAPDLAFLALDEVTVRGHSTNTRILALAGDAELRRGQPFQALLEVHDELSEAMARGDQPTATRLIANLRRLAQAVPEAGIERICLAHATRIETILADSAPIPGSPAGHDDWNAAVTKAKT